MKIKKWELDRRKDELRFRYKEDLSYLVEEINDLEQILPVEVIGVAYQTGGDTYTVKGQISTTVLLRCSKCLQTFDCAIESDFLDIFIPEEIESQESQTDENIHLLTSDEIDISSIVEELFLLQLPYVPLCSKDCKGLCPVCGTNLNEKQCDCDTSRVDPRLADLAKWFDQKEDTK
ncbi:DUF177 domain-containing protein [Tepidibacillus marianensis]|uniref:YceD family protein n=1 Tax=Tepidibacillus marianensis TaxID=3131995 RepID=UPI0030CBB064